MIVDRAFLGIAGLLAIAAVAATSARAAEDAVDADGRATPGALALDDAGRLRFTPNDQVQPLPSDAIAFIRFPVVAAEPFRVGFVRRVLLDDGQQITGRFLSAEGDALSLRTAWVDRIDVPRSAVIALRQPPGRLSVFEDDFADGLKAWAVSGKATVAGDPPAAALTDAGQALTYAPTELPADGRVGFNFRDRDASGARWSAEFRFKGDGEPRTLRVLLGGPGDAYEVEAPGLDGDGRGVARSAGWHRLEVRFSHDSLSVLCDDVVLWSNLRQGPGGALRQVALSCTEAAKAGAVRGRVEFTDFTLARNMDEPPRPPGDASQDEIWLAEGDQLFGDIIHVDKKNIEVKGFFGKRSLPWSGVRGCWFKPGGAAPAASDGARVRLWLDSGLDPAPDVLVGVLKAIDAKQLTLQHPRLGELHFPRDRLRKLRPL
jgi:hypothetical protein